jgi:beta-lactamase class A
MIALAALLLGLAMNPDPPAADPIAETVRAFRGVMGVAAKDLVTGKEIAIGADLPFPTASTIKVAVMVEVFHQIEEGRLKRDQLVTLSDDVKVGEPVVLNRLHPGLQLSVMDLVSLMITVSDNTATNLLVGLVGTANVDKRLASYGLTHTKLFRPTFRDGHADVFPEPEKEFGLGVTTPREMARLLELIAIGKVVGRGACDEMIAILREQHDRAMIPRSLPEDVRVANKAGEDLEKQPDSRGVHRYVRADAAIVEGKGARYVIAIFTRHGEDTRSSVDNAALVAGATLSRLVYDLFSHR